MVLSFDMILKRIDYIIRLAFPQALLVILIALSVASIPLPFSHLIKTHLVLMAIYYWSVFRPGIVPPVLCFCVGLLMDILGGLPLGLSAVILVTVRWVVTDQRRFLMGQPYITVWAVFALILTGASGLEWALLSLKDMALLPFRPALLSIGVGLFLFPFVTTVLQFAHRLLPGATRVKS